ncbi:scavenger receptor class B member 1-like [Pectinophora gossypiella]|uniref:scavenger receptor class B member 1-like n=1 Tax=Pectinophora gossypiella TaxID=13191 RepID=UPI00214DF912|nr:scavenger receptor class B member 1-like [Pectinophora gossypiella]
MEHQKLENMASTALMLPKENGDEKVVILTPGNGVGKILIREDTILANLQGCAGCGKAQFTCGGGSKRWSALCWGRQSDRKYYCLLTLLSATFVLSLIGTIFFCFTNTINDAILSNMVIRNNSLAFSIWQRPNVNPLMKVHIFNYTNWERVRSGQDEKLKVEDVGPYVYSQQLERVNIKFWKDQLSFQERNHFKFLPDKSAGAHFDKIIVPNLPLLGVVSKAIDMNVNSLSQSALNYALTFAVNHPNAFIELPVARFLWGYDDTIIDTAKPFLSLQGKLNFDKFGLLVTKNGTVSDRLTINTGENDKDRMNMIQRLNGEDRLPYWGSQECNSIEASDGSIFPPLLLDRKTPLHVFYPNLCRRLPFKYDRDIEVADGIQLLRYRMPQNVFDDPAHNPANQCYCEIDTGVCPPRGVINVTACAMGAPALVSFPHFNQADPELREQVLGMHPDPEKHDNYLDVHPTLGIALSGKSSLQFNIQVRKTPMFSSLNFLPHGLILPIAWVEMSVEELPESLRSLVYHGTYSTAAVQLGLIVTSVIALVVSGICLCLLLVRKRQKPCMTLKKVPVDTELKAQQLS